MLLNELSFGDLFNNRQSFFDKMIFSSLILAISIPQDFNTVHLDKRQDPAADPAAAPAPDPNDPAVQLAELEKHLVIENGDELVGPDFQITYAKLADDPEQWIKDHGNDADVKALRDNERTKELMDKGQEVEDLTLDEVDAAVEQSNEQNGDSPTALEGDDSESADGADEAGSDEAGLDEAGLDEAGLDEAGLDEAEDDEASDEGDEEPLEPEEGGLSGGSSDE